MKKIHSRRVAAAALIGLAALILSACAGVIAPAATPSAAAPVVVSPPPPSPAPVCVPCVCPQCPEPAVVEPSAAARPLQAVDWTELPGWSDDDAAPAWPAFRQSCKALKGRSQWPLWRAACTAADELGEAPAGATVRRFIEAQLQPHAVTNPDGTREGLITGYYEPLLKGSRTRKAPYVHAVFGVPDDLLSIELADVLPELKDKRLRGRLQGNRVVPYYSRAELREREGSLQDKAVAYVDDAVELFFLQIQGSGRVRLPDGSLMRLGYADQNGHPYQSIGRLLIERGELKPENASMQGIQAWARANPKKLNQLLDGNPSFVFFRELAAGTVGRDDGPIGALGVPITAGRSLAIDPRFIPLGAPVFLSTTQPNTSTPLNRLMLAQDTGGAIKGAVRADFFLGFGAEAGQQAGRMKQRGRLWVLLPVGYPLPAGR